MTGFLGSGKTTLLNHILTKQHGKKLAIIENEFGDVGIDDALLKQNMKEHQDEEIIEMMNGCICCTVRQDLIVVLEKLQKRVASGTLKLDGIVIETTGMADPAPVAQTFFVDDNVQQLPARHRPPSPARRSARARARAASSPSSTRSTSSSTSTRRSPRAPRTSRSSRSRSPTGCS